MVTAREDTLSYRLSRYLRRNGLGVAAVGGVVLALAGGIVAARYEARQARQRFDAVRGLANEVLTLDGQLSQIPATAKTRQMLLRTVLRHLEQLAKDAKGDIGLEMELSTAYRKAGGLQSTLPNSGEPRESLRRAIDLGEQVRASGKADGLFLASLARSYYLLGIRYFELGNPDDARRNFLTAIDRAKEPGVQGGAAIVANSNRWLGRMENESGQVARAVQWMEEAVRAARQSVQELRNPTSVQDLVSAQLYLARSAKLAGNLVRTSEISRTGAREAAAIYKEYPRSSDAKLAMVVAYVSAGAEHAVPFDMLSYFVPPETVDAAVDFARRMTVEDPETNYWQTLLVHAYLQQASVVSDVKLAELAARNALAVVAKQLQRAGDSKIYIRNQALSRIQLANCLRAAGDRVGAVEQAALAMRELSEGFNDREAKAATLLATMVLASVNLESGDKLRAAERFESARKIAESLVAADKTDMRMAAFLALTYEGLGACARGPAAAGWYAKSVELWKSWPVFEKPSVYSQVHQKSAEKLLADARRGS